jgi:fructokinase
VGTAVVAVAGEAITDLVPAAADGLFRAAPGGSPANIAVGLARLGVPVRMLARLSEDALGRRLRDHLARNGVDLSRSIRATEASSLAIVVLDEGGSAEYDFRVDGTADWQWTERELDDVLDGVDALHVGSLALTIPPGGPLLLDLARRARSVATVTFDPNVRPLLMGTPQRVLTVVDEVLAVADVVKASADDLEWLVPGAPPEEVAADWQDRGPALVVVTRGGDGAVAVGATSGVVQRPGRPVEVVDTVGAGDSFMAALVAGLQQRDLLGAGRRTELAGLSTEQVLGLVDEAVTASSITCSRLGADPPTAFELRERLGA